MRLELSSRGSDQTRRVQQTARAVGVFRNSITERMAWCARGQRAASQRQCPDAPHPRRHATPPLCHTHTRRGAGCTGQRGPVWRRATDGAVILRKPRLPGHAGRRRARGRQVLPARPLERGPDSRRARLCRRAHGRRGSGRWPAGAGRPHAAPIWWLPVLGQPLARRPPARAGRLRGARMDRPLSGPHPHRGRGTPVHAPPRTGFARLWRRTTRLAAGARADPARRAIGLARCLQDRS
jgi:hypothetical protein